MLSYLVLVMPAFALAMWAQHKVKSTYATYAQVPTRAGLTGADVTERILRDESIALVDNPDRFPSGSACGLAAVRGVLTDHYDPRTRTLNLSDDIYHGRSIAALGIAAHEAGHAIQHARLYSPLMMRNIVYPVCSLGSTLATPLIIAGALMQLPQLLLLGIAFFTLAVVFTLITLPVEFNASSRAIRALSNGGYLTDEELGGAKKVLDAAALTYVAAAAVALAQLLNLILSLMGSRR